jgi:hypothetical protein
MGSSGKLPLEKRPMDADVLISWKRTALVAHERKR